MSRLVLSLAAAVGLAACAPSPDVGRVDLALTGQSASGVVYRLRNATLLVDDFGPAPAVTYRTEDDPTRPVISDVLDTGTYSLVLQADWRLERVAADGTATPIVATMLSANPQVFAIAADATTRVALRFRAEGDVVELGDGDLEVVLEVEDAPAPSIVASPASLALLENTAADLRVSLSGPPAASTVVQLSVPHTSIQLAQSTLVFTAADWNVAQLVRVTALDDADAADVTTVVTLAAPGLASSSVALSVRDDDALAIVASPAALQISEGTSATLSIALTAQPPAAIQVTITSSDPRIIVSPSIVTFTPGTHTLPREVSVLADIDPTPGDRHSTLTLAGSGVAASVTVAVLVPDAQPVVGWIWPMPAIEPLQPNQVVAYQVNVPPPGFQVEGYMGFGFAPGPVQIGIYRDIGGIPGPLLGPPSLPFGMFSPHEPQFSPAFAPFFLPPGTYWLAMASETPADMATEPALPPVPSCTAFAPPGGLPPFFDVQSCGPRVPVAIGAVGRF
jgi:hypothetical protein